MKKILIAIVALGLTACGKIELPDNIKSSKIVAICHDGTKVVRSNDDGRLRTVKSIDSEYRVGYETAEVEDGVSAKDVCR
jgi:hypothetical protein